MAVAEKAPRAALHYQERPGIGTIRAGAMDIAALVLVTVLFLTTVWAVIQAGQRHQEYEMIEVVVRPGDTLWGLARQYAPDMDPREAVYIIRTANGGIDPGRIQPGDMLLIPQM